MKQHRARKRFGQHFLVDLGVIDAIVRAIAPGKDDTIVEIGPGLGAMTEPLARAAGELHLVELDRDLAAALRDRWAGDAHVTVHEADALSFDFTSLGNGLRVVGNLPYNISTPLLFHLLGQRAAIRDMHFMLQREVAERLAAEPGTKARGRLSVGIQHRFAVEPLFDVPPESFAPPPKVFSTVVRLTPRPAAAESAAPERLEAVVRLAFASRRKRLGNALKPLGLDWVALGIDERLRPADLSVAEFVAIANAAAGG